MQKLAKTRVLKKLILTCSYLKDIDDNVRRFNVPGENQDQEEPLNTETNHSLLKGDLTFLKGDLKNCTYTKYILIIIYIYI